MGLGWDWDGIGLGWDWDGMDFLRDVCRGITGFEANDQGAVGLPMGLGWDWDGIGMGIGMGLGWD